MNKVTITELIADTFKRSTLIAIPSLTELFELNDTYTKYEVFFSIVQTALQQFERYYPLYTESKIFIEPDEYKQFYFKDNFKAYLDGKIDENTINLIPTAITGISRTSYMASSYVLRTFRYDPPKLTDFWYSANVYWVKMITNRPLFEEYDEVTEKPTDRCAIYYMTKDVGSQYKVFRDELYCQVCRYIINIKKNMGLQNMPIELFQGLEDDYQKVSSELENHYMNSLTSGQYII